MQTYVPTNKFFTENPSLTEEQAELACRIFDFAMFACANVDGYVTISVMPPDRASRTAFVDARDQVAIANTAIRAALRNQQGFGVYLGMAGRKEKLDGILHRGGDADVTNVESIWCDIDHADLPTILQGCERLHLPPSLICHTREGDQGYHLYWWLTEPMPADEKLARILTTIANEIGDDTAMCVPSASLRVPGTWKWKTAAGHKTTIIESTGECIRPETLDWLDPGPEPKRLVRPFVKLEGVSDKILIQAADVAARCDGMWHSSANRWQCRCPVPTHGAGKGDRSRSMSVKDGDDGVLITCFAGCSLDSITEALGLKISDLFFGDRRPATRIEMRAMSLAMAGLDVREL